MISEGSDTDLSGSKVSRRNMPGREAVASPVHPRQVTQRIDPDTNGGVGGGLLGALLFQQQVRDEVEFLPSPRNTSPLPSGQLP